MSVLASFCSLLWLTWYISCSVLHALMMMLHHAALSTRAKVAYHFSPVLPAWPWMTLAWLNLHPLPHYMCIKPWISSWIIPTHQWCTIEHFWTILDPIYPHILSHLPCGLNMLAMHCARVRCVLMGCRTTTRALSLRSFPGVTLAQVGPWNCLNKCLYHFKSGLFLLLVTIDLMF